MPTLQEYAQKWGVGTSSAHASSSSAKPSGGGKMTLQDYAKKWENRDAKLVDTNVYNRAIQMVTAKTPYQIALQQANNESEQEKNFANSGLTREEYYQQMQAAATRAGKKATGLNFLYAENPNAAKPGDARYDPFAAQGSKALTRITDRIARYILNNQNLKEAGAEKTSFKDYLTGKFVAPTREQRDAAAQKTDEEMARLQQDRSGFMESVMMDAATANARLAYAEKHRYDDVEAAAKSDTRMLYRALEHVDADAKQAEEEYQNYLRGEKENAEGSLPKTATIFSSLIRGTTANPNTKEINADVLSSLREGNDALIEGRSNITGRLVDRREYYPQEGWTWDQRRIHAYLYETDRERADQYAMDVNARLNYEAGKEKAEAIAEDGVSFGEWAEGAVGARIASGADYALNALEYGLEGGVNGSGTPHITNNNQEASLNQIADAVDTAITNNLNGYDPTTGKYTKVLDESIPVIGGKGWGDAYQLGMSMIQSTLAAVGGPATTYSIFFGSAAQSAYEQALERGATQGQALTVGALNGVAEGLFEAISIKKVEELAKDRTTVLKMLRGIGLSGLTEGSEEINTGIADLIIDAVLMAGQSETQQVIHGLMAQGMSYDEAWKAAFMGNLNELAYAGLGGFISGVGHNVLFTGLNVAADAVTPYEGDARQLIDEAKERGVKGADKYGAHEDVQLSNLQARRLQSGIIKSAGGVQNYVKEKNAQAENDYNTVRDAVSTLNMEAKDEESLMTSFLKGKASAQDFAEGVKQAFTAGRIGLTLEQAQEQFADTKINSAQFEQAFEIGKANQTPDIAGMKAKIDGKDYSIRMKGKDTVVFKATDGSIVEMPRTEALTRDGISMPAEAVQLMHAVEQFGENAGEIYNLYTGNLSIESYAAAMNSAIHWAESGVLRQRIESGRTLGQRTNLTRLTEEQIALAEKIGEAARKTRAASAEARAESLEKKPKPTTRRKGRVVMNGAVTARGEKLKGVNYNDLNKQQQGTVKALQAFANLTGIDYIVYDGIRYGTGAKGSEAEEAWGFYENGKVYVNINAGTGNNFIALATMSHEMVHFMRDFAPREYAALRDEIVKIYYENDPGRFEDLVQDRMKTGGDKGTTLSYDAAVEEIVANSCMEMFQDSDAVDRLCAENPGLGQRILDTLKQLIKKLFGNINNIDFDENKFYKQYYDAFTNAQDLFAAGIQKAAENAQKGEAAAEGRKNMAFYESEFSKEVQEWYDSHTEEERRKDGGYFTVGTTSDVLMNLGVKHGKVRWGKSKVNKILNEHGAEGVGIEIIKKAPWILEKPIILMKSKTVAGSIVGFSEFETESGRKVIVALDLAAAGDGYAADYTVITGNYSRRVNNVRNLVQTSEILYIDPSDNNNRANTWLNSLGVQFPSDQPTFGSIGRVTYDDGKVNIEGKTWAEITAAAQTQNAAQETKVDAQNAREEVTVTEEDGKTFPMRKYSLKSMDHDIQEGKMFEDLKTYTGMTDTEISDLRTGLQNLMDQITLHRDILDLNETFTKNNRPFKPFKPNSDPLYTISLDFSTLCRKRLMTQYVIEKLQTELDNSETGTKGRALSAEEQLAVRDLMKEYAQQEKALKVACAMCYVEAARLKAPKQINKFLKDPEAPMLRYFALKNKEFNDSVKAAQADFKVKHGYDAKTAKKDMKPAHVKALNDLSNKLRNAYGTKARPATAEELEAIRIAKTLPNSTYLTAANLAQLAEEHPVIYDAYTATIRTATRSKSLEADIPYYYGDSQGVVSDEFIQSVNAENGMRFSSWSDFQIQHMLDMMTAVIELSTRKCSMHGYTKFLEQVRIFGKTGMMFNMSGVPQGTGLKADGSLDFSPTESVLVQSEDGSEYDAIKAREEFPETAGLQCIGISNEHILALLRSEIIDYVIPYHTSGLNASLRRMAQISNWDDFTSFQNASEDKSITFDKNKHDKETWHKEPVFSEFFSAAQDPANGYKEGEAGIVTMRRAADQYKKMCAERGLRPKFSWSNSKVNADFSNEPNYWKLLIDRKMINQKTGALIEQKAVRPDFDFGLIEQMVQAEVDAYDSTLQDRALDYVRQNLDQLPQRIKDLKKSDAVKKAKADSKKADELSKRFNELQAGVVAAVTEGSVNAEQESAARPYQKFDASINLFNDGFYSRAEQVVTENMPGKMAGNQVVKFLTGKGVKAEEIRWSGIVQFLEGKKSVSKEEVLSFLQQNRVQVRTQQLDNTEKTRLLRDGYPRDQVSGEDYSTREEFEDAMREQYGNDVTFEETNDLDEAEATLAETEGPYYVAKVGSTVVGFTEQMEVDEFDLEEDMFPNSARWGRYALKGGQNYREILFKFPGSDYYNDASNVHWKTNAPGTFAHARLQDFVDDRGKNVLFVEEIQSDWHNAGARERFSEGNDAEYAMLREFEYRISNYEYDSFTQEEKQKYEELKEKLTPLYPKLRAAEEAYRESNRKIRTLVRAIREEGRLVEYARKSMEQNPNPIVEQYLSELGSGDIRALINGAFHVPDLPASISKTVREVANRALEDSLSEAERSVVTEHRELRQRLSEIQTEYNAQYTKAMAEAVPDAPLAGSGDSYLQFVMKNLLRMAAEGGYDSIGWTSAEIQSKRWSDDFAEGYRIEYDQDLPKFMRKYGNQWGMKVGTTTLNNGSDEVWSVDLTDAMKETVTQVGQPMYQKYSGDQLSMDDMTEGEYSRSAERRLWDPERRKRMEQAEDLTRRVERYLGRFLDDDEMPALMPRHTDTTQLRKGSWEDVGDIANAEDAILEISNLTKGQMAEGEREEAYRMMEELLLHAGAEARTRYIPDDVGGEEAKAMNRPFLEWYRERHPSLYYEGYVPGQLGSRVLRQQERAYLENLLASDKLALEDREAAEDFLARLNQSLLSTDKYEAYAAARDSDASEEEVTRLRNEWRNAEQPKERFYMKYDPGLEMTATERNASERSADRVQEEKQLLQETLVMLNRELKKLKGKVSGGNEVREDDCRNLAKGYISQFGSTVSIKELSADIKALGDYIVSTDELDDGRIREMARGIADKLIDRAREVEDPYSMRNQDLERHKDAVAMIQGKKFYFPEELRGDLAREGGYSAFRRANMGRFTLNSSTGDSIDALYTELHDMYPDLFPELNTEGDQIIRMAEIFEEAKPDMMNPYDYEDGNFIEEVTNQIYEDILGEAVRQKVKDPSIMALVSRAENMTAEEEAPALTEDELKAARKTLAGIEKSLTELTKQAEGLEKRWATVSANEELAQKRLDEAQKRIENLSGNLARMLVTDRDNTQARNALEDALRQERTRLANAEALLKKAQDNAAQVRQQRDEAIAARQEAEQKQAQLQRQLNRQIGKTERLEAKLSENAKRTRERLDELRAEKNERIEQVRKAGIERVRETQAREKAEKWEKVAELREYYREKERTARERRLDVQTRRELRSRITKMYNEFVREITHPTEGRHIPPEMMKQAVDVLQALNMDTSREGTKSGERLREKLAKLKVTYDAVQNDKDFRNAAVYDETVSAMLQAMIEEVGDTPINRMTAKQMESVYNVMTAMRKTARDALKIKMQGEERDAYEVALKMTGEVRSGQKPNRGLAGSYLNTQLTPERMFNRLGGYHKDSTWSQVYKMLNEGQLESTRIFVEGSRIFEHLLNSKEYDGYVSPKNMVDVGLKDENGNTVMVTHDMLVSLWMHLQNEDNVRHAILGGLTIPNQKQYYNGNRTKGSEEAVSVLGPALPELKRVLELREQAQQTEDPEVKREIWREIGELREQAMMHAETLRKAVSSQMTTYDRQWAAALTELFDVYSKEQLNRTTLEVYGIKRASVEHYWPINVDGDFLNTPFESVAKDFSIENAGFMKERVSSTKPIRLVGSSDVASSQLKKVSQYSGLMPVIRSFNKIWGKTQIGYQDSLRKAVHQVYGDTGVKYIENLMADLNGARSSQESPFGQTLNKLRGNMAQAALTLSMRTAFGQTASYPTAAAVVGWKPLMQALAKGGKDGRMISRADTELIERYSPLLRYRMMGFSTTELGDISTSNSRMARIWKKMRWLTGWIQAMDGATVGRLWYAAEYYVDDHNKSLQKGTDAYYEEVAKVFNDIVEKTQPDYTTMQRPDILRNPNALVRSLTMFMTQRLQNANIMYDAAATLSQMKKDYAAGTYGVTKEDVQQAAVNTKRAASSLIVASVTITAFKFLADVVQHSMNAYRDKDKDLTEESVGTALLDMFLDSMISNLLAGSEVYRLVESKVFGKTYYGIEVSGISTVSDVAEDLSNLFDKIRESGFKVGEYKSEINKSAKDIAQLLGLPLSNGEKIVMGIINHGRDIANGEFGSFEAGVERKTSQNGHRLYRAYVEGDKAKVQKIREEAGEDQGALNQSIAEYIKDLYKEGELTEEETKKQLMEYAEVGKFTAADAIGAINFEKDFGFKFNDIKDHYLEGSMTAKEAVNALVKYGNRKESSAQDTVEDWKEKYDFDKRYGTDYERYDLTFAGAKQYYKNFRNQATLEEFADQWKSFGANIVKNYYNNGWKQTGLTVEEYAKNAADAPIYGDAKAQAAFKVWSQRLKPAGMSLSRFTAFLEAADADGNDSLKQDELGAALLSAIASYELSQEDAEALWNTQEWASSFTTWSKKKKKRK